MDPALVTATWQAAALSGLSSIIGQAIKCYQQNKPLALNLTDLAHFILFSLLVTPPNYLWQAFLERKFPAHATNNSSYEKHDKNDKNTSKTPLSIRNTATKFLLDQTLGATVNTLLFIAGLGLMRGQTVEQISYDCQTKFWPLVEAGLKLWPAVSLANFSLVPLEYRTLVGSTVGLFWGVYLSLVSGSSSGH